MDTAPQDLATRLQAEYDAALRQVVQSVPRFTAQVESDGASVYYDPEDQELLLVAGDPVPTAVLELDDTCWMLVEPETDALIGFEIPHVPTFAQAHADIAEALERIVQLAAHEPGSYVRVRPPEITRVAEELRELICA